MKLTVKVKLPSKLVEFQSSIKNYSIERPPILKQSPNSSFIKRKTRQMKRKKIHKQNENISRISQTIKKHVCRYHGYLLIN